MNLTIIPALALGLLAQVTINLYDPKSRDAGYARVNPKTGSVDLYDPRGERLGYGKIQGKGDLELFKPNGERLLTGKPAATPRSKP